jgi:hypothetical protein
MKRRKFKSAAAAQQARELDASWSALLKKYPSTVTTTTAFKPSVFADSPRRKTRAETLPSVLTDPIKPIVTRKTLSPEMLEREKLAQKETAKLKQRVAPIANKMGYQYISDGYDLTTIGKKV